MKKPGFRFNKYDCQDPIVNYHTKDYTYNRSSRRSEGREPDRRWITEEKKAKNFKNWWKTINNWF